MIFYKIIGKIFCLIVIQLIVNESIAQNTVIKGLVLDSLTRQPLQFASIYFKGGRGTITNADGSFVLQTSNLKFNKIEISYSGYKTIIMDISPGVEQDIYLLLAVSFDVQSLVITNKRRIKYRNKDNPAVGLIRKVIENKEKNKESNYSNLKYEQYDRMTVSFTKKPELLKNKLLKKYNFVFDAADSTSLEGKPLFPIYMEERLAEKYYKKDPTRTKTFIQAEKKVNYGEYLDSKGISTYLERLYESIDVYKNNISILANQFLSPIATLAPSFYQFYIRDTVELNGQKLVKLYFTPRNTNDLLFRGTIFITLDGNYAVQKLDMTVSKKINLNWVKDLKVAQDFEKSSDGRYHLSESHVLAEFAITKGSAGTMVGEKITSVKGYVINEAVPDSVFGNAEKVYVQNSTSRNEDFWDTARHIGLSPTQSKVYANIDSLHKLPSFRRLLDWGTVLLSGYKSIGPYEIGPFSSFYNFNTIEGLKLLLGGRSTPKFSNSIFFENYLAYGIKDKQLKYFGSVSYSLNHKSIYAYPLNFIKISYLYDTQISGEDPQSLLENNILLAFKRGINDKWLYTRTAKAEYTREFGKGLRWTIGVRQLKNMPAIISGGGGIKYYKLGASLDTIFPALASINTTEFSAELRWAPHEQFYQGKVYRISIFNKYPIFRLKYTSGIKGLFGSQYNYGNLYFSAYKRFYLSQLGYTDVLSEANYIFGQVPFPLLNIHRANQSYAYQVYSYNLMNFMEFVSDHSASINIDHNFSGFFLNKIPLIRKLKLREVASLKMLVGGVRNENDPTKNSGLFVYPYREIKDARGNLIGKQQETFPLGTDLYMEASVGIANIFKILRVDVVKRFFYLNHPNVPEISVRAMIKFEF